MYFGGQNSTPNYGNSNQPDPNLGHNVDVSRENTTLIGQNVVPNVNAFQQQQQQNIGHQQIWPNLAFSPFGTPYGYFGPIGFGVSNSLQFQNRTTQPIFQIAHPHQSFLANQLGPNIVTTARSLTSNSSCEISRQNQSLTTTILNPTQTSVSASQAQPNTDFRQVVPCNVQPFSVPQQIAVSGLIQSQSQPNTDFRQVVPCNVQPFSVPQQIAVSGLVQSQFRPNSDFHQIPPCNVQPFGVPQQIAISGLSHDGTTLSNFLSCCVSGINQVLPPIQMVISSIDYRNAQLTENGPMKVCNAILINGEGFTIEISAWSQQADVLASAVKGVLYRFVNCRAKPLRERTSCWFRINLDSLTAYLVQIQNAPNQNVSNVQNANQILSVQNAPSNQTDPQNAPKPNQNSSMTNQSTSQPQLNQLPPIQTVSVPTPNIQNTNQILSVQNNNAPNQCDPQNAPQPTQNTSMTDPILSVQNNHSNQTDQQNASQPNQNTSMTDQILSVQNNHSNQTDQQNVPQSNQNTSMTNTTQTPSQPQLIECVLPLNQNVSMPQLTECVLSSNHSVHQNISIPNQFQITMPTVSISTSQSAPQPNQIITNATRPNQTATPSGQQIIESGETIHPNQSSPIIDQQISPNTESTHDRHSLGHSHRNHPYRRPIREERVETIVLDDTPGTSDQTVMIRPPTRSSAIPVRSSVRTALNFLGERVAIESSPPSPQPYPAHKIKRLPSVKVTQYHVDAEIECAICTVAFRIDSIVTSLPCTHIFHQNCAKKWLKINGVCPLCKLILV